MFDEPTTALDIRVRAQIIDLIRELAGAHRTDGAVHNARPQLGSLAGSTRGRDALGEIVEQGPSEAIFARPTHAYTRTLLSAELPIEASEERESTLHASDAVHGGEA